MCIFFFFPWCVMLNYVPVTHMISSSVGYSDLCYSSYLVNMFWDRLKSKFIEENMKLKEINLEKNLAWKKMGNVSILDI